VSDTGFTSIEPSGHLQVKPDRNGRSRSYWAFWTDAEGKHGRRLGPAHVKDSGRRTARGAIVWRAGDGSKPSAEHLVPKQAAVLLDVILRDAPREVRESGGGHLTLAAAYEGMLASKQRDEGLKRSTVSDYDCMAERVFRELGAESPVSAIAAATVLELFDDLRAERVIGATRAEHARAAGKDIREISTTALYAWPPGTHPVEVATKQEAVRIAEERGWTWKHRRRGVYRVTPVGAQRPRRIRRGDAAGLRVQGWHVELVERKHRVLREPASTQTHRKYRDFLNAIFDWAIAQGTIDDNPVKGVGRKSRRGENSRILRRSDFYDHAELDRLLEAAPGDFERAFWLCGFHAGLRLPGEALGLLWGAIDFRAEVLRPYGNWVRNGYEDTTKTGLVAPVPMTPELKQLLGSLKERVWAVADDDFVFTRDQLTALPADERALREAFRDAGKAAGLKAIPMYNSRHSFGTALAREGVDVRTIQTLMRHKRLATTEIYMAYSPRPDLHRTLVRALSG
jgi:integrase